MQHIDAGKASLLVTLDPVLSVSMAILILGEHLPYCKLLVCVLVFEEFFYGEGATSLKSHRPKSSKNRKAARHHEPK